MERHTRATVRDTRATLLGSCFALALCGGFAASACNMVTGADRISLYELEDDDSGASSGGPTGSGGNTSSGTGGDSSSSGNPSTTNASSSSGAQQASSSSGGPEPCTYPAGPYGVAQGNILPPSLSWQAYAPGANAPSTVTTADLFDCDGSKGIDALIFDTSQFL